MLQPIRLSALCGLPAELVSEIVSQCENPRALCLVNKQMLQFARPELYKTVELSSEIELDLFIRTLETKPEFGIFVRIFRFDGGILRGPRPFYDDDAGYTIIASYTNLFNLLTAVEQIFIDECDELSANFLSFNRALPNLGKIALTSDWMRWKNPLEPAKWTNLAKHHKLESLYVAPLRARMAPTNVPSLMQPLNLDRLNFKLEWFYRENVQEFIRFVRPKHLKLSADWDHDDFDYEKLVYVLNSLPVDLQGLEIHTKYYPLFEHLPAFQRLENLRYLGTEVDWLTASLIDTITSPELSELCLSFPAIDPYNRFAGTRHDEGMRALIEKLDENCFPKLSKICLAAKKVDEADPCFQRYAHRWKQGLDQILEKRNIALELVEFCSEMN